MPPPAILNILFLRKTTYKFYTLSYRKTKTHEIPLKMKLFLLCAVLITCTASAQTELGKMRRGGIWLADLTYSMSGTDTVYALSYKDQQYRHVDHKQVFIFRGSADSAYQALRSGRSFHPDVAVSDKGMYILVHINNKGYFNATRREVDKLFGRR
jgi:hypothetical protein